MIATLPQLPANLEELKNLKQLIMRDETLMSAVLCNEDIGQINAKSFSASEVKLEKLTATSAILERTSFSDIEVANSDLIAVKFSGASWRRVRLQGSRCSGIQLQNSILTDITFADCKLDLANFRFSKLTNIHFKDCVLDEADFYSAELHKVTFQNCSMNKTEFSGSKLKTVDLRSSDILNISGVASLAGSTIDSMQLMAIAPILANELRISVKD